MRHLAHTALALLALAQLPASAFDLHIWNNDPRFPGAIVLRVVGGDTNLMYQVRDSEQTFTNWNDVVRAYPGEDYIMRFNPKPRPPTFYKAYAMAPELTASLPEPRMILQTSSDGTIWTDTVLALTPNVHFSPNRFFTTLATATNISILESESVSGPWRVRYYDNHPDSSSVRWRLRWER